MKVTSKQRETLRLIRECQHSAAWRYDQPPACKFNKQQLDALLKRNLIRLVSCPMYIRRGHPYSGKGVELTKEGIEFLELR